MIDYRFPKHIPLFFPSVIPSDDSAASHRNITHAGQTRTAPRIISLPIIAKEENWLLNPPQKPIVSPCNDAYAIV